MNLVSILDAKDYLEKLFELSSKLKGDAKKGMFSEALKHRCLGLIFEKPSTRTRVSFEVAMAQLGGNTIYLDYATTQLRRGEAVKDTARVLSRYLDAIVYRAHRHEDVMELARHSSVPVINGLSDLEHPTQLLSDLFTIKEKKGSLNQKLAFIGDGNNVCNSLLLGCALVGMNISVACPKGYEPDKKIVAEAKKIAERKGSNVEIFNDPAKAAKGAGILYTDVWVSMGQEREAKKRLKDFKDFQINKKLVALANSPLVMHCLPAKRGLEITEDVLESGASIVFDQAENRLHVQKALLLMLLGKGQGA